MKTMHTLVSDILSLSNTDMAMLAEALAMFDTAKAEHLEYLLSVYCKDERTEKQ